MPAARFPYAELIEENRRRTKHDPEFELIDTGAFADDRYFDVAVEYGLPQRSSDPHQCQQPRVRGRAPARPADAVVPQHVVVGAEKATGNGRVSREPAARRRPSTSRSARSC